ncbi:hypothetical protein [Tahibacter amnicola]|uniref:hypothetical protein n=1 Tax=Tahibacter amnicola TaxID=2976241 RepID=UPI003CCD3E86
MSCCPGVSIRSARKTCFAWHRDWPDQGLRTCIVVRAPLARLAGYTTALRSLTQGRAGAAMSFDGYEEAVQSSAATDR